MILDITSFLLLGPLCASLHWLLARSFVFQWFWSRARGIFADLLACPACSGFWLGTALGVAGMRPLAGPPAWLEILVSGLMGVFMTPICEGIMLWGLKRSAIPQPAPEDSPPESSPRAA